MNYEFNALRSLGAGYLLADKMLEKNKELQKLDPIMDDKEYNEIKEEIEKTNKKIDQKVYELYGLGEEEIKIVEEK